MLLQYELTQSEVQNLLNLLDNAQFKGRESAKAILLLGEKLENPLNSKDLQKQTLENLKKTIGEDVEKEKPIEEPIKEKSKK